MANRFSSNSNYNGSKLKIDWENFKRAPQILKQKTGIGSRIADEEFDVLYDEFTTVEANFFKLNQYVKKYSESSLDTFKSSLEIGLLFKRVCDPNIGRGDAGTFNSLQDILQTNEARFLYEEAHRVYYNIEKYIEAIHIIEIPVKAELKLLEDQIQTTIKSVVDIVKNIRKNIRDRDLQLLDYNRHSSSKNNALLKADTKHEYLYNLDRKLSKSKEKYESKNNMLKKELPHFFKLARSISDPIFVMIYFVQLTMTYQFSNNLSCIRDDMGIDVDLLLADRKYKHLLKEFSDKNSTASDLLNQLSIISFHKDFLNSLTRAESDGYTSRSATTDTIDSSDLGKSTSPNSSTSPHPREIYCVSQYKYIAQGPGDLTLNAGDRIKIIDQKGEWWKGEMNGYVGVFPSNYVKIE